MTSHFISLVLVSVCVNNILLLSQTFLEVELMRSLNWSSLSLFNFVALLQRREKKAESAANCTSNNIYSIYNRCESTKVIKQILEVIFKE